MLLIFSWSVICSIMAYCVSLGSMTRTLEKRARVPPPKFLIYCFIFLYSVPLASVLCLHISFLGYLKLSGLLLPLLNNPCIVGTQCLFTVNLFMKKFHEKTFMKREPLFTYLSWARHCAQNFTFII